MNANKKVPSSGTPLVRLQDVTKEYVMERQPLHVLRGVTLDVDEGEFVVIVGRSGAGKSTLLHLIGGLDTATSGTLQVAGQNLHSMSRAGLASFRNRKIGFVFQFHHLLPEFTAVENVAMPLLIAGRTRVESLRTAREFLEMVELPDRMDHKPSELSGGEQQRVAVARALVARPALVLADEPSGNLDSETGERLHDMLRNISRTGRGTFIIVTHNMTLAARAERVLEMRDGLLIDKESV